MIKKLLTRILLKIVNLMNSPEEVYISSKNLRVIPWLRDKGDETHRLNYNLNENSLVFDLGGYLGDWSYEIYQRYECCIHIFEPVDEYCSHIKKRLDSPKIKVNQFGLARNQGAMVINLDKESSSIFKKGELTETIRLEDFVEYVNKNNIDKIDLVKINIEGAEYDLLDYLLETKYISRIINLQVQFHDFFPDAEKHMKKIQAELSKTHELTYQYNFIWENWRLKS